MWFASFRRSWNRSPLLHKVLAGNAIVVITGAIGGTFITNALVQVSAVWLALFFAVVGILLSLLINYLILRDALRPMDALQSMVERIDRGDTAVRAPTEDIGDPQLRRFALALNTMLERLAAHMRMIEANRAQVRRLSGQLLTVQEDERKRIARELHDDTSGALARLLLNIEMCEEALPEDLAAVREKMRGTRVLAEQTLESVRKMIFDLRPTLLDDLGLAAAIRWYAKNNLEPAGIQVQVDASNHVGRASARVETAMFRIAQEAINNIIRHSCAQHAYIRLTRDQSKWLLIVQDDGQGFDTSATAHESNANHHWGLFGIQERVELLSGTIDIRSSEGKGTTIKVEIPVE